MKRHAAATAMGLACLSGAALAQADPATWVRPEHLRWFSPPNLAVEQGAWVLGAEPRPRPDILRMKLAAGGHIPPHTPPDERNSIVLAGPLSVGFGGVFDEAEVVALAAGSVSFAPANTPYDVWARDGDVMYQEAGIGSTATGPFQRQAHPHRCLPIGAHVGAPATSPRWSQASLRGRLVSAGAAPSGVSRASR